MWNKWTKVCDQVLPTISRASGFARGTGGSDLTAALLLSVPKMLPNLGLLALSFEVTDAISLPFLVQLNYLHEHDTNLSSVGMHYLVTSAFLPA